MIVSYECHRFSAQRTDYFHFSPPHHPYILFYRLSNKECLDKNRELFAHHIFYNKLGFEPSLTICISSFPLKKNRKIHLEQCQKPPHLYIGFLHFGHIGNFSSPLFTVFPPLSFGLFFRLV